MRALPDDIIITFQFPILGSKAGQGLVHLLFKRLSIPYIGFIITPAGLRSGRFKYFQFPILGSP